MDITREACIKDRSLKIDYKSVIFKILGYMVNCSRKTVGNSPSNSSRESHSLLNRLMGNATRQLTFYKVGWLITSYGSVKWTSRGDRIV